GALLFPDEVDAAVEVLEDGGVEGALRGGRDDGGGADGVGAGDLGRGGDRDDGFVGVLGGAGGAGEDVGAVDLGDLGGPEGAVVHERGAVGGGEEVSDGGPGEHVGGLGERPAGG